VGIRRLRRLTGNDASGVESSPQAAHGRLLRGALTGALPGWRLRRRCGDAGYAG
jgi:hypothetical protein